MSEEKTTIQQMAVDPVSDGLPRNDEGKYFPPMYEAADEEIPPLKSASIPERLIKSKYCYFDNKTK